MSKVNVDLAARRAMQQATAAAGMSVDQILEIVEPCMWNLLVEPITPKEETSHGIVLIKEVQQAEEINTTNARVLAVGPTAMDGKTNSGIVIRDLTPKIQRPADLIGKVVVFQKFTGQTIVVIDEPKDRKLIFITTTEILGIVHKPEKIRFYI